MFLFVAVLPTVFPSSATILRLHHSFVGWPTRLDTNIDNKQEEGASYENRYGAIDNTQSVRCTGSR